MVLDHEMRCVAKPTHARQRPSSSPNRAARPARGPTGWASLDACARAFLWVWARSKGTTRIWTHAGAHDALGSRSNSKAAPQISSAVALRPRQPCPHAPTPHARTPPHRTPARPHARTPARPHRRFAVILVFANKTDLPHSLSPDEITREMRCDCSPPPPAPHPRTTLSLLTPSSRTTLPQHPLSPPPVVLPSPAPWPHVPSKRTIRAHMHPPGCEGIAARTVLFLTCDAFTPPWQARGDQGPSVEGAACVRDVGRRPLGGAQGATPPPPPPRFCVFGHPPPCSFRFPAPSFSRAPISRLH